MAEAIRLYTMGGAWQDHAEHVKGSLEAGKLADFCILDRDILSAAPDDIPNIRTFMTIVDGKVVHDTGDIQAFDSITKRITAMIKSEEADANIKLKAIEQFLKEIESAGKIIDLSAIDTDVKRRVGV